MIFLGFVISSTQRSNPLLSNLHVSLDQCQQHLGVMQRR
jgi:hypothetical protein